MNKYYCFTGAEKFGLYYAKLPENSLITNTEIESVLLSRNNFPIELELKPFANSDSEKTIIWHDYMYNEFAFFMVSEKLKIFLEERKTRYDKYEFIKVKISDKKELKNYFILHFYEFPDVLDEELSTYNRTMNSLLVPCISAEKPACFSIFPLRMANGGFPSLLYLSEALKKEMKKQNFSNIIFEKAKTSFNGKVV